MMWTSVAIVATLMISVPSLSSAQARGARQRRQQAPRLPHKALVVAAPRRRRVHPGAGAKDLKSVLFNWALVHGHAAEQ